jgi:transcriptional regulator of heat shock response
MSKNEKLEARIRNNPRNVSLEDFESLVCQYGEIKEGGNHPLAIVGKRVFPYRRTNPVLIPYVVKVLELIEALNK